jgi:hypothetical protein
MRSIHRTPVLTLVLLASTLRAVELAPDLEAGGFARGLALAEVRQPANPRHSASTDVGRDEQAIEFVGEAQVWTRYQIGNFRLRADLFASSDPEWQTPVDTVLLEQAYVEGDFGWGIARIGRYRNTWLGWEGHHAPELFRVRHSAAWDWNVQNHALKPNQPFLSDGISVRTPDDGSLQAELHVVEDVFGDGDTTSSTDKAIGGAFRATDEEHGMIELGWAWDPNSTTAGPGRDVDAFGADLNGHWKGLQDAGWLFAAEVQFHHHPDLTVGGERFGNDLIVLGMARYDFDGKTSGTVMIDWVERGFAAPDNEVVEYALAVTHRPHPRVRLDAEVSYDDESADDADRYGVAVAATVMLP